MIRVHLLPHNVAHPLMGRNCNWICCCLCQQFPFGSVGVAVITPCAKRHVTSHTNPWYYSLSLFFSFWDWWWCHRGNSQFTVSSNLTLTLSVMSSGRDFLIQNVAFRRSVVSLCQLVSQHSCQVNAVAPGTFFVLPKCCPPVLGKNANWETKHLRMGFESENSFYRFTFKPLKLGFFRAPWHFPAVSSWTFVRPLSQLAY